MQSCHGGGGGGSMAKSSARSTKRTMPAAAGIGVKMTDKRTRVATSGLAEKAPPPAKTADKNVPGPPDVVDVVAAAAATANVGKSATGDDESADGNDDAAHEPTWTVDNYVRLLRKSLKTECQSHNISNGRDGRDAARSAVTTPGLGEDAVAVLVKRAMTAVQVYTLSMYLEVYIVKQHDGVYSVEYELCDAFRSNFCKSDQNLQKYVVQLIRRGIQTVRPDFSERERERESLQRKPRQGTGNQHFT